MKKGTVIAIIVVAILVVVLVWVLSRPSQAPTVPTAGDAAEILGADTTSEINEALESLDLSDLDAEFQQIDADLNQL